MELDPSSIEPGPAASYMVPDDDADARLVTDLRDRGQLSPITVCPIGDGQYRMIDGHRRLRAHAAATTMAEGPGKCGSTLRAIVRQVTDLDAALENLADADHRRRRCALESAHDIASTYALAVQQSPRLTLREFGTSVGRAFGTVSEQIRIAELVTPALLRDAGAERPDGAIVTAVRKIGHTTLRSVTKLAAKGDYDGAAALLRAAVSRASSTSRSGRPRRRPGGHGGNFERSDAGSHSQLVDGEASDERIAGCRHRRCRRLPASRRPGLAPGDAVQMVAACAALVRATTAVSFIEAPSGAALVLGQRPEQLDAVGCDQLAAAIAALHNRLAARRRQLTVVSSA
jgi:hypothetical protein